MQILLMGAQGAGKGTQAEFIGPHYHLVPVATGALFRAAIASGSELGNTIKAAYDRGELIKDDITLQLVEQRLREIAQERASGAEVAGGLFDGFPRNQTQAAGLDRILADLHDALTAVIYIDVPYEVLVERLAGRRVCPVCGRVYNVVSNPPQEAGKCDADGAELIQREDDTPAAIRKRLDLYFSETAPLIDYYRERGLLVEIDGNRAIDEVRDDIIAAIDRAAATPAGKQAHAGRD